MTVLPYVVTINSPSQLFVLASPYITMLIMIYHWYISLTVPVFFSPSVEFWLVLRESLMVSFGEWIADLSSAAHNYIIF